MNTPEMLLRLPKTNPSHDLCFFLRSTGPTAPHRRPSTLSASEPSKTSSRNGFRFRKLRQEAQVKAARIREAVGLPADLVPSSVEQKASSSGKKYFALKVDSDPHNKAPAVEWPESHIDAPTLSPSIVESRVSISFAESINASDQLGRWRYPSIDNPSGQALDFPDAQQYEAVDYCKLFDEAANGPDLPIRPRASNPPTPEPISATSMADSYTSDLTEYPAQRSFDVSRALTSHPVQGATSASLPLPGVQLTQCTGKGKEVEMEHPCPRRYASHNVLFQRESSFRSSLHRRSITDSPGPPPPRSPLRPRSDARTIDGILASYQDREPTSKVAPSVMDPKDYHPEVQPIMSTVTTECTGPIKRPNPRGLSISSPYRSLRRQHEQHTRSRKLRDPPAAGTSISVIDAVITCPPPATRQKLRKTRPRIEIPPMKPLLVGRCASSSASSNASWRNVTDPTLVPAPVSTAPSSDTPISPIEKTGYTPISPTTSSGSTSVEITMALSPVMLVAEEVPLPKSKQSLSPMKMIVRQGKHTPRPRSASIPRSAMKRRSRQGTQTLSRPNSPAPAQVDDDPPPLPLPPPNRALPPTPPASGSEKARKIRSTRFAEHRKELPSLPTDEVTPKIAIPRRRSDQMPHIATMRKGVGSKDLPRQSTSDITMQDRVEQLEKNNALLSAALAAVLRTNGSLNMPLPELGTGAIAVPAPMSWETRVTRRSAASHAASSSNGSALDMYMTTRHVSTHGR